MGTSGSSNGPGSGTPLVPSWLGDGADHPPSADSVTLSGGTPVAAPTPQPLPPIPSAPPPGRFAAPRRNFSRFAGSAGRNRRALRRAVRDYVRVGTGGSGNATRRMGASRSTARSVLGVFRDFQREGVNPTLARLSLANLAGRPLDEVFIGLTDVVCGDGGSIDEGVAREAWLETIGELDVLDVPDLASLSVDQMRDIFLAFIAHSIVGRLLQDIGANGFKFAADLAGIAAFGAQLKSYIRRSVRDSFSGDLSAPAALTDQQIRTIVDRTYLEAWDLLVTQGDAEA